MHDDQRNSAAHKSGSRPLFDKRNTLSIYTFIASITPNHPHPHKQSQSRGQGEWKISEIKWIELKLYSYKIHRVYEGSS